MIYQHPCNCGCHRGQNVKHFVACCDQPIHEPESLDPVVGHKTLLLADGTRKHQPLHKSEADALWAEIETRQAKRLADMPTEQDALSAMFEAYTRLKELGWREAIYCPKNNVACLFIEPGSTGIHEGFYMGEWPKGGWWLGPEMSPSYPCLYKEKSRSVP